MIATLEVDGDKIFLIIDHQGEISHTILLSLKMKMISDGSYF
jgi:hypothetical protein